MPPRKRSRLSAVPDSPPRALGYVRVSKAREEMISPTLQRTAIEDHCSRAGYVLLDVISDLDATGRNFARAGVQDAISQVEAGAVDVIVVWKFSRFGRSRRDWAINLDRVESVGGRLESATEHADATTSTGRLTRGLLAELAAWESEVKGDQWRETFAHRRSRGLPHTSHRQLGYVYVREHGVEGYLPDPDERDWVRALFERFVQGDTHRALARWLNSTGRRTTKGGLFDPSNLARWMDGGFAAGLLPPDGRRGAHEPIVDDRLWQQYLARRERTRVEPAWVRAPVHPLAGLVTCGLCRGTMQRASTASRGRPAQRVFVCRNAVRNGGCRGVRVYERLVHDALREWLGDLAGDVDRQARVLAEQKVAATTARADRRRIARDVARLDASLARLTVQLAEGLVPPAAYATARDELAAQRDQLVRGLADADDTVGAARRPAPRFARTLLDSWEELLARDPGGLRDVVRELVADVRIDRARDGLRRSSITIRGRWEPTPDA